MKPRATTAARDSFFGLVTLWFLLEYLRPGDYATFISYIRPGLILLIVMTMVWLARGDKTVLKDNLIVGYGLFIALGVISVLFATNTYWAAKNNLTLIAFFFGGVLPFIAFMKKPESLRSFFIIWVLVHSLIAVGGIIRDGKGSGGFMGDENDLALTLAMALPFAYFLAVHEKSSMALRVTLIVAGLVMVAAIVDTRSRGGFLGMMMASLAIILFSRNRVRNLVGVGIFGGLAALVLTTSQLTAPKVQTDEESYFRERHAQSYMDEMSSIQDATDATRRSRIYYWGRAWEMFLEYPLFGVGTGNYPWRVADYEKRDPTFVGDRRMSGGRVAHSLYFTLLAEYGVVGTSIFVLLAIGVAARLQQVRKRLRGIESDGASVMVALSRASSASLLAFLVSGAFLTVIYYPHFWYLLGFAISLDRGAAMLCPQAKRAPIFGRSRLTAKQSEA